MKKLIAIIVSLLLLCSLVGYFEIKNINEMITPYIQDGYWYINGSNTGVKAAGIDGIDGQNGIDGKTPYIQDGYWYIDGVNTNVKAWEEKANKWVEKKAVFIGDSITYANNIDKAYYDYLKEDLGFSLVESLGISGSCISSKSDYGNNNQPLINRYQNVLNYDLIVVFMGTNDYGHETPIGEINDMGDISFYGALNEIISGLINNNPTSAIVFVTPLHRYGFGTSKILNEKFTYDYLPNGRGHTLGDYRNAIINTCSRWSIPVIDLYGNSGLNPSIPNIKKVFMPDGLHPNAEGHKRIAEIISLYLDNLYVGYTNEENDINTVIKKDALQYGNKFASSFNNHNRASSVFNIFLEVGQTVTLIDNVNYQWALAGTATETSNIKDHGYYPEGAWSSIKSYTIEKSGYYGVVIMLVNGKEFDFENEPDSNSIYNYIIIE